MPCIALMVDQRKGSEQTSLYLSTPRRNYWAASNFAKQCDSETKLLASSSIGCLVYNTFLLWLQSQIIRGRHWCNGDQQDKALCAPRECPAAYDSA